MHTTEFKEFSFYNRFKSFKYLIEYKIRRSKGDLLLSRTAVGLLAKKHPCWPVIDELQLWHGEML